MRKLEDELHCSVSSVMKIDYSHKAFPKSVPTDYTSFCIKDRRILNDLLLQEDNGFDFFHQFNLLHSYLACAPPDSKEAAAYRKLP